MNNDLAKPQPAKADLFSSFTGGMVSALAIIAGIEIGVTQTGATLNANAIIGLGIIRCAWGIYFQKNRDDCKLLGNAVGLGAAALVAALAQAPSLRASPLTHGFKAASKVITEMETRVFPTKESRTIHFDTQRPPYFCLNYSCSIALTT